MRIPKLSTLAKLFVAVLPAGLILFAFGLWALVIGLSAHGVAWFGDDWDYERTGQLGDSFGVVSALMTTFAALFTFMALRGARASEAERAISDYFRDNERTFFQMLDQRFRVLADIRVGPFLGRKSGTDGAKYLIDRVRRQMQAGVGQADAYRSIYQENNNDLGHYFRFTYHCVTFAKARFGDKAVHYTRLLRAQLSNAEMVLIALNCAHGHGIPKFKPLVENFKLLHNVDQDDIEFFGLRELFAQEAFDGSDEETNDARG